MHGSSMLPAKKKKQVWLLNGKFHPTGAYVDLLAGRQTCQYVYLCIHVYVWVFGTDSPCTWYNTNCTQFYTPQHPLTIPSILRQPVTSCLLRLTIFELRIPNTVHAALHCIQSWPCLFSNPVSMFPNQDTQWNAEGESTRGCGNIATRGGTHTSGL